MSETEIYIERETETCVCVSLSLSLSSLFDCVCLLSIWASRLIKICEFAYVFELCLCFLLLLLRCLLVYVYNVT